MDNTIRKRQRQILRHLVEAGKITQQQMDTQPVPEDMKAVIPDVLRICKDDEAVAAAVAKAVDKRQFFEAEDGIEIIQGEANDPWFIYGGVIYMTNPFDDHAYQRALSYARQKNHKTLSIGVVSNSRIEQVKTYNREEEESNLDDAALKVRAIQRIEDMIREAAKNDVSDIHLQPTQGDQIAVRYRMDGELITIRMYKIGFHDPICRVIIENLCGLSLETSVPQDGKFEFYVSTSKKINLRVSSIPVARGSERTLKIVMRLLGNNATLANLDKLGMDPVNKATLQRMGACPNGMIILTGPTGSGKTTTLNALLLDMQGRDPNRNYHTIEEPVELQHEGMCHTECGAQVSFAAALRSLLRQDPDVVLVGEMRDNETAELGYKAAMTGHLVLSTLHTNNAHESLGRLERMNIERDIIVTNTMAFIAQRLVRALCKSCKIPYELRTNPEQFKMFGSHRLFKEKGGNTIIYKANTAGCSVCKKNETHHSGGLKGRRGVIEILEMTPETQMAILEGETPTLLRRRQIKEGTFRDLWDDGLRLVAEGSVSIEQLESELKPYLEDRGGSAALGESSKPVALASGRASVAGGGKSAPAGGGSLNGLNDGSHGGDPLNLKLNNYDQL